MLRFFSGFLLLFLLVPPASPAASGGDSPLSPAQTKTQAGLEDRAASESGEPVKPEAEFSTWQKALLDTDKIAAAGGALIILTSAITGNTEMLALGGFLAAAGCAHAFHKNRD